MEDKRKGEKKVGRTREETRETKNRLEVSDCQWHSVWAGLHLRPLELNKSGLPHFNFYGGTYFSAFITFDTLRRGGYFRGIFNDDRHCPVNY